MAQKIFLPPSNVVQKWNEEKVIKWLKKMQLEDCIPAFENRRIDGSKLLELTEQKLFAFQDMKIKHRGQIAKCVNECKSQASNAKRIVGTIRHHKSKEKTGVNAVENGDYYESDDDFDYWDSDFDEDFDDDVSEGVCNQEFNSTVKPEEQLAINQPIVSGIPVNSSNSITNQTKFIPKPPNVPVITPAPSQNSQNLPQRNGIPRPPLKRPPSQPPPPPVAAQTCSSPNLDPPLEDYEIPINHQGSSMSLSSVRSREPESSRSSSHSESSFSPETYEVITPQEENYEIVESPPLPAKTIERPVLPPRSLAAASRPCAPPPLPQKPKKIQEALHFDKTDGCRPQNRPKLPVKQEEENASEGSSVGGIGSAILNSFLGRKNSSPSPKLLSRSKDLNCSDDSITTVPQNNSPVSSQSSLFSAEKEGAFVVGSSSFLTGMSPEAVKPLPHLPPAVNELGNSNMATRPLPPVPQMQNDQHSDNMHDISALPWFHEIERHEAELEIQKLGQNGAFLVRPSKRAGKENPYTLTCLHDGKVFHLNIRQRPDGSFALGKEKKKEKCFPNVAALISYHQNDPILLTSRGESAGQTILRVFPHK